MKLSLETLKLCKVLLDGQQLSAGADDFAEVAGKVVTAKQELEREIGAFPEERVAKARRKKAGEGK